MFYFVLILKHVLDQYALTKEIVTMKMQLEGNSQNCYLYVKIPLASIINRVYVFYINVNDKNNYD